MCKIIIVDNTKEIRDKIFKIVKNLFPEHEIYAFPGTKKALNKLSKLKYIDIVIFNSLQNNNPNGLEFAEAARILSPNCMLIYMSDKELPDYNHLKKLARVGIDNYLLKPFTKDALEFVIINSITRLKTLEKFETPKHRNLISAVDKFINMYEKSIMTQLSKNKTMEKSWLWHHKRIS